MSSASDNRLNRSRDAVRILHILDKAGDPVRGNAPEHAVKVIKAELRLQKLDFWMRNPDHLANELLNQYEHTGDPEKLDQASQVMAGDEPELRTLGMLKFFFGAYERIDDAVGTLKMLGFVAVERRFVGTPPKLKERDFFLLASGAAQAAELAKDPLLRWYADRAELVAKVAGKRTGGALKTAQYSVAEYDDARWGDAIAPIAPRVRARLAELRKASS